MAETNAGTAKVTLALDLSEYSVSVERARSLQAGLGDAVTAQAQKMTSAQKQSLAALNRNINALGLNRQEVLALRAAELLQGDALDATLRKIKANSAALESNAIAQQKVVNARNAYGLTQKQENAALRQVPAQLTDIFVSLQGGQNPLTVLLQQGGQLRDIFGGAVPAITALGRAVLGLVNPVTVTAAAVLGLGAAWLSAEQRQNKFNQAIILTGQQGRVTADELSSTTEALDNISGVTGRQAADVLTQVAASGLIAANHLSLVTEAAARMEDATGKAASETIAEYVQLARDPYNSILKLNEAEHFLTQSIADRIKALQDSGDIEGAVALATETRAAAQIQRAQDVVASLGLVSGAWHAIKESTGEAWDEAVNYFSRLDKEAKESVGTLTSLWNSLRSGVATPWALQATLSGRTVVPGDTTAAASTQTQDTAINSAVQKQLDVIRDGNRSRKERQDLEETQIINLYKQLGISKEDKRVQDALAVSRKRYNESLPKGQSGTSFANAQSKAVLQAIKDDEAAQRNVISNTTKLLQANYSARTISAQEFYTKQRELTRQDVATQEESITKQIEHLRSRNVSGKDSADVVRELHTLETQLSKVRADGATTLAILAVQEQDAADKRKHAIDQYAESLQTANEAAIRNNKAAVARITLSTQEAAYQEKVASIYADVAEKQRQLNREFAETNDKDTYDAKLAELREFMDQQVRIAQDGYKQMKEAQSDWVNGFKGALARWIESASDAAGQASAITGKTLDGLVDSLTDYAVRSKDTFGNMLRDIGQEIARFMLKKAVLEFINLVSSYFGNSAGSTIGSGGPTVGPYNARGAAYDGTAGLSAFSGTIVNQPTLFPFARGAGVMGEAGPEGIFPLKRGSDGKLGVVAQMAGGGAGINLYLNMTINNDGSRSQQKGGDGDSRVYKQLLDEVGGLVEERINRAMLPGGKLWKVGVSAR